MSSFNGIDIGTYMCPVCSGTLQRPVQSDESIALDRGKVDEVKEFCYLGDMFDSERGADIAVRIRMSVAWFKLRECNSLLSNKAILLKHRPRAYNAYIRSTMTYGAATWALTQREESLLQSCDRRMLRKICGLSLTDLPSTDILRRCGLEDLLLTARRSRMAWFGRTYRRQDNDPLSRINQVEAPGRRPREIPKKTWKDCVNQGIAAAGVQETAAADCAVCKTVIKCLTYS